MITIAQNFTKPVIKGPSLIDDGVIFDLFRDDKITVVSTGSESQSILDDVVETSQTGPTVYNEGKIVLSYSSFGDPIYESLDQSIAVISTSGVISRVGDGVARILVTVKGYTRAIDIDVSQSTPDLQNVESNFVSGSLGGHVSNNIDNLIAGKDKLTSGGVYTSKNHATKEFTRNPDVWTGDIDLTCVSSSNSYDNQYRAGTLVTPRHVLTATHFDIPAQTKLYFTDNSDNTIERTTTHSITSSSVIGENIDLTLSVLDSTVPAGIKFCKVPPALMFTDYIIRKIQGRAPAFGLDQDAIATVSDLYDIIDGRAAYQQPENLSRLEFFEEKITGDSGNPSFFIINDGSGPELVLVNLWLGGFAGFGASIANYITEINQMISNVDAAAGISTGYTLTEADLSAFPTYT